jgi:hypothetical protein
MAKQLDLDVKDFNGDNFSIFFHIPKTGGTSLSEHLSKVYERYYARLAPEKMHQKLLRDFQIKDLKAVLGHYRMTSPMYQQICQPFNHVTVLREPVDRVVSQYYYLRQASEHPNHTIALENSLLELFEKGLASTLGMTDRQVDLLSTLKTAAKPRLRLGSAKYSLINYFTFFGLYEKLDEFTDVCSYQLGWPTQIAFPRVNHSTRKSIEELNPKTIKLISDANQLDRELYSYAEYMYGGIYQKYQPPVKRVERLPEVETIEVISVPDAPLPPRMGFWRKLYFVFFEYDLKRLVSKD